MTCPNRYAAGVGSSPYDVAVIGAGIAGLAATVFLRNRGLSVVCLDAQAYPHRKVGESLDWSSPGLLRRLGIDIDRLIADGVATPKRRIAVREPGRAEWTAAPPTAIRRHPLRFETMTLHVDRTALDARLFERAAAMGTTFIWERVARVEATGDRVTACATTTGRLVDASWYIDASGTARLFARSMGLPETVYGRPKVCLWTYFDTPPLSDGTTFFVDNRDPYLSWTWDIPISPTRTSIGFVTPADAVRDQRRAGKTVETILRDELARHPRLGALLEAQPSLEIESTSFQPYVTETVCGANWLLVGEAAAMPDPLTGNGFTSGIRHARHTADAIGAATNGTLTPAQRRRYGRHVGRLGHAFNAHIENAVYRHHLRWGIGLKAATYVYTFFAFFMNALHARFDPRGTIGMAVFGVLFAGAGVWIRSWRLVAGVASWARRAPLHGQR